ncbi:hypothetical protein F4780DRAFT_573275 [Xylariomycetidae sp. FL0641]|nr:hypothetical protein F4780DRAFT_573275 [Xylariomycetidae sp. FL0641]
MLIDALNELEDQTELPAFFHRTFLNNVNVRLIVSSREHSTIRQALGEHRHIRIEDATEQVSEDIDAYVRYRLRMGPSLQWLREDTKQHISESLRVSLISQPKARLRSRTCPSRNTCFHMSSSRTSPYASSLSLPKTRAIFCSKTVQAINADSPFSWHFYHHHATSVCYAATLGLTRIVSRLVQSGAKLDSPGSRSGGTALHGAVYRMHTAAVKILLKAGADACKVNFLKVASPHSAASLGDLDYRVTVTPLCGPASPRWHGKNSTRLG